MVAFLLHPILGESKLFLTIFAAMFIRRRKNKSGSTTIVVVDKSNGRFTELYKVGTSKDESEILELVSHGKKWIRSKELSIQPELDLYGEEREAKSEELATVE
ncbi:hypothetical protein M2480_002455, partial [Parabacteroides sp. PFB2-12]|nr:hypothetical protein [Parabacteroides sp. PM6-13]MDH6391460.1 hypothetical protein [Parabacteroides sp. PFB2-12]